MSSSKVAVLEASEDFVQSLARGLAVLRTLGSVAAALPAAEVAQRSGLSRPVVRRLLLTLEALGYVGTDAGRWFLTPRVMEFGFAFLSTLPLRDLAEPVLQRLGDSLRESCSIAINDGSDIVYVARAPAKRIMSISLAVGTRLPAYCTSLGRVLLAELTPAELSAWLSTVRLERRTPYTVTTQRALRQKVAEARAQGYAIVDQELEVGVRSIAVPIRDGSGRAVAALNCGGDAGRLTTRDLVDNVLPLLAAGASEIGRGLQLQHRRPRRS